jgi:hypothetical protein
VQEWNAREMSVQDGFSNRLTFFDNKVPKASP